jgi:CubicO group peptidase (beta-lactamase class C family)
MFISAYDQARFGLLSLHEGAWDGKQLLSEEWVQMAKTPTALRPTYGFMNWFLNTNRDLMPSARESHFYHGGAGVNRIWVAPDLDTVVVVRWISGDHFDGFVQRVLAAISD